MDNELFSGKKQIWIYGFGIIGKQAIQKIEMLNTQIQIKGIVVTKLTGNEETEGSYKILQLDQMQGRKEDIIFIIAVSKKYQKEITDHLHRYGYRNYVIWKDDFEYKIWQFFNHGFMDKRKHLKKVLLILAGYKEFLWDNVFERVLRFLPEDTEVCLLSSGLYSEKLMEVASKNEWSYLWTEKNNVSLIQNMGISLFAYADWIFKMDEDIFVTEGCFEAMLSLHQKETEEGDYEVGMVVPLIPVNGYGHIRILDYLGMRDEYTKRFGRVCYGGHRDRCIESDPEAAKFMWGYSDFIPQIDELNRNLQKRNAHSYCNVRFSIGFILFHRSFFNSIGELPYSEEKNLGLDESHLCGRCMTDSKAIVVAENVCAGHFSFKLQAEEMRKFYEEQKELFEIQ